MNQRLSEGMLRLDPSNTASKPPGTRERYEGAAGISEKGGIRWRLDPPTLPDERLDGGANERQSSRPLQRAQHEEHRRGRAFAGVPARVKIPALQGSRGRSGEAGKGRCAIRRGRA